MTIQHRALSLIRAGEALLILIICLFLVSAGAMASWFYWYALDDNYPGSRMKRYQVKHMNDPSLQNQPNTSCHRSYQFEVGTDNLYFIDGQINSVPVKFLLDTGANVTTISSNMAQALGLVTKKEIYGGKQSNFILNPSVKFSLEFIETASGREKLHKALDQSVSIAGQHFKASIVVLDMPADYAILGTNILTYFDVRIKQGIASINYSCSD